MTRFHRRLISLEHALAPETAQVTALEFKTGGGEVMALVGGKRVPCHDVTAILKWRNPAVKVYIDVEDEE